MENLKTFVSDIKTYRIMSGNVNYRDRLHEAYLEIKRLGINSYDDFSKREGLSIGAFTYTEMTIFDRLNDDAEYASVLNDAWFDLHNQTEEYRNDPQLGDKLASWGTLGRTPYRAQLVNLGAGFDATVEEERRHFGR